MRFNVTIVTKDLSQMIEEIKKKKRKGFGFGFQFWLDCCENKLC